MSRIRKLRCDSYAKESLEDQNHGLAGWIHIESDAGDITFTITDSKGYGKPWPGYNKGKPRVSSMYDFCSTQCLLKVLGLA